MTWFHSRDGDKSDFVFVQEISIMERQFMLSKVGIYIYILYVRRFGKLYLPMSWFPTTSHHT
jgi:hypothetical protein